MAVMFLQHLLAHKFIIQLNTIYAVDVKHPPVQVFGWDDVVTLTFGACVKL